MLYSYVFYRDHYTRDPNYRWSNVVILEYETTLQVDLEHHLEQVMKPQNEGGFQLPPPFRQHGWNQLAVEADFTYDCMKKKTAISAWEEEFKNMEAPAPLRGGDGKVPPPHLGHPNWVYDTGRIATPWAIRTRHRNSESHRPLCLRRPKPWTKEGED